MVQGVLPLPTLVPTPSITARSRGQAPYCDVSMPQGAWQELVGGMKSVCAEPISQLLWERNFTVVSPNLTTILKTWILMSCDAEENFSKLPIIFKKTNFNQTWRKEWFFKSHSLKELLQNGHDMKWPSKEHAAKTCRENIKEVGS